MNRTIYLASDLEDTRDHGAFTTAAIQAVIRSGDLPIVAGSASALGDDRLLRRCDVLVRIQATGPPATSGVVSTAERLGLRSLSAFVGPPPHESHAAPDGEYVVVSRPSEMQLRVFQWLGCLSAPLTNAQTAVVTSTRADVVPTLPVALPGFVRRGTTVTPSWFRLYGSADWSPPPDFHLRTEDCTQAYWTMIFHGHGTKLGCTLGVARAHLDRGCPHRHPAVRARGSCGYVAGFACQRPLLNAGWDVGATWQLWDRVEEPEDGDRPAQLRS